MNTLPIVTRELTVRARKRGVHRIRLLVTLIGLLGMMVMVFFFPAPENLQGRQIYILVSVLSLLWAFAAGVLLTADAINEERNRGTLGLLFLTHLRPSDILLGKLAVSSLNGIYALVALLPLFAIPMLLGGVPAHWVIGHGLLALATLFLSLCAGLYASTRWPDPGTALARGLSLMVLFAVVPIICVVLDRRGGLLSQVSLLSPVYSYVMVMFPRRVAFGGQAIIVAIPLIMATAAGCFLAAAQRVKREGALEAPAPEPQRGAFGVPVSRAFGKASPPPAGLIDSDPIMWLLWRRNRFPRADLVFLRSVLMLGVPMGVAAFASVWWWAPVFAIALVLHLALASHMQSQACKRIATEEDRSALELLITTPRAATGTLEAHHRAFKQLFQTQFWWLAGIYAVLALGCLKWVPASDLEALLLPLVPLVVLVAGRFATSWVGLNGSLRHGRYHKALAQVQLWVALPTWGYALVLILIGMVRLLRSVDWWTAYALWLVPGAVVPWLAGNLHRRQAIRWMKEHGTAAASIDS